MRYALVFPGQGSQQPHMLPWLEDEADSLPLLTQMAGLIGADWRARLELPALRCANQFAQALVVGTSIAAWLALRRHLNEGPVVVAGYSVGELAAYACAGVLAPEQALGLTQARATAMDAAVAGLSTGLLSVAGKPVAEVLSQHDQLECAIHIRTDHGIFAGALPALEKAQAELVLRGAVCKLLDVPLASHSHWMASARDSFAHLLDEVPFQRPVCPVACGATGALTRQPAPLRQALGQQIASTVQWSSCMEAIAELGVHCVLEVGAGTALAHMWNEQHPRVPARSLSDFRSAQSAAKWIMVNP
jgi:[acyl-carrier-protein] S-malonyltransferase